MCRISMACISYTWKTGNFQIFDGRMLYPKEDKHYSQYYDGIFILFHTGLRISEFCGLTISDIDLKRKCINVDHQLIL